MSDARLAALRNGDEDAFRELVTEHTPVLMRLALAYSPSRAVAEEAVQETWVAVLRSIDRFEGRSSLGTWICRILINTAIRRGASERRSLPFSDEPAVDPGRFLADGPYAGHWSSFPTSPSALPEAQLESAELRERIREAVRRLTSPQREVFTLRDVEGWSTEEVADLLELSVGNVRVLLHRARAKVRQELEDFIDESL